MSALASGIFFGVENICLCCPILEKSEGDGLIVISVIKNSCSYMGYS